MPKVQLASLIFKYSLTVMKKILDLVAFKVGKQTDDYKYYKKEIMDYTYSNLKKLYRELSQNNIIEKCPKHCNLTQGYKSCECGGSGFLNKTKP